MKKENGKIIYGVYYRKSSEDQDKQINSIEDQMRDLDAIELRENLNIAIKYPGESQSAFTPGRLIFGSLTKDIETGKINSILTWNENRLSRNPIDSGILIYLMDIGKLIEIKTPTRTYHNNANDKFMLNINFGSSKKDSDDKSVVVKRALEGRAKRGLPHGQAKIGYLNDKTEEKGNRSWLVDKVRLPLVRIVLNKMLSGKYNRAQLYVYAKELGLKTVERKKQGGKPLASSYIYNSFLTDPIYAGFFFHNGIRYELDPKLERAITEDQYWQIQDMLGSKGVKRMTKREAVYSSVTKCGTCNGSTFPDFKFQVICSVCKKKFSSLNKDACISCGTKIADMIKPTYLSYVYYNCINDKKHRTTCLNNGIEEKKLQKALVKNLKEDVSISRELSEWCIENIHKLKDSDLEEQLAIKNNLEQQELGLKAKLKEIAIARISREMTNDEEQTYIEIESETRKELELLSNQKNNMNVDWFSEASKDFDLMAEVVDIIENGTAEQKKDTLFTFGSNLSIKDKKVIVSNKKSIETFSEFLKLAQAENEAFEPRNSLATKGKTEVFASVIPTLLRDQGSNLGHPRYIYPKIS
jgi:site-specific DNA recombinase